MMKLKAFTLIELLLYVAIISIVLSAILPIGLSVVQSSIKNSIYQELGSVARNVLERIKYEIRNASYISSVNANSITVINDSGASLTIDSTGGKVRINIGNGPVDITPYNTYVESLIFTDGTSVDDKSKNIQIQMKLRTNYSNSDRIDFKSEIILLTSVELRRT